MSDASTPHDDLVDELEDDAEEIQASRDPMGLSEDPDQSGVVSEIAEKRTRA
ncbi:MAG TPA: hypothetical protein VFA11_13675 [Acidimicrobiales bacterium]|nr:hypothetical protein [Acidimicrobiales bacterium]